MTHTGVLSQADIFYEFSPSQIEAVAAICQDKAYELGQTVFEENSASDELYVIAHGEVEILIDPAMVSQPGRTAGRPTTIAKLRRGQCFGEVALVDQGLRSATARSATVGTRLLVIPHDRLMALCETDPSLGYILMRNLAADLALKIRNTDLAIRGELLYERGEQTATGGG
ncbi:MAG TPA: cyclic nucleotide-binding domain-containing protein [Anaerolineales bacterium]